MPSESNQDRPVRIVAGVTVREFEHALGPCQIGRCGECTGVGKNGSNAEVKFFTCPHECHGRTEPDRHEVLAARVEARMASRARAETPDGPRRSRKQPGQCQCGCGGTTKGGRFLPGHDAKLKSALKQRAKAGDQDAVAELAERGW